MPASALVAAFPGQGSLAAGVGTPWLDHPCFEVVSSVASVTGCDVARLLTSASDEELVATRNAQLATFALSLAIFDATGLRGDATWMLGHSLGEYTALVAAGFLERSDGARLVDARGTAMLAASTAAPGGLVALIGGDDALADAACSAIDGLAVANRNGPGQIVLGGPLEALDQLAARAKELGFRRAIPLRVGGAFHTPLMAPAAPALAAALAEASFRTGAATVVSNVDGAAHPDPEDWAALLERQLTEPVDWARCVKALPEGATVVELGPGGVLAGLTRRIRGDLVCVGVGAPEDLAAVGGLR